MSYPPPEDNHFNSDPYEEWIGIFLMIKDRIVTFPVRFIAARNRFLNGMVDMLVNIKPITDEQNFFAFRVAICLFIFAGYINFYL